MYFHSHFVKNENQSTFSNKNSATTDFHQYTSILYQTLHNTFMPFRCYCPWLILLHACSSSLPFLASLWTLLFLKDGKLLSPEFLQFISFLLLCLFLSSLSLSSLPYLLINCYSCDTVLEILTDAAQQIQYFIQDLDVECKVNSIR